MVNYEELIKEALESTQKLQVLAPKLVRAYLEKYPNRNKFDAREDIIEKLAGRYDQQYISRCLPAICKNQKLSAIMGKKAAKSSAATRKIVIDTFGSEVVPNWQIIPREEFEIIS